MLGHLYGVSHAKDGDNYTRVLLNFIVRRSLAAYPIMEPIVGSFKV